MTERNGAQPTSFWMDENTKAILDELVTQTGMTRSAVVREAIRLMHSDPGQTHIRKLVKQLSKAVGA